MTAIEVIQYVLANALIVVYLFYAWSWNLPDDRFLKRVANRCKPPFIWLGLWHAWSMFAPNPITQNRHIEAEIETAEGQRLAWRSPSAADQSALASLWFARERKMYEFMEGKSFPFLHTAFCRYLMEQHRVEGVTPIAVSLILVREPISFPPNDGPPPRPERQLLGSMRAPPTA